MKPKAMHRMAMVCLAAASTVMGQEIKSIEQVGDQVRVEVLLPPSELEVSVDGGQNFTTEAEVPEAERTKVFMVPIDAAQKLVRLRSTIGGDGFGTEPLPLLEEGTFPAGASASPTEISLRDGNLVVRWDARAQVLKDDPALGGTFPLLMPFGVVLMDPTGRPGEFAGPLPAGEAQRLREELTAGLTRLQQLENGRVPQFAGREFKGDFPLPDPATVGEDVRLFPFSTRVDAEPVTAATARPVLGASSMVAPERSLMITDLSVVEDPDRTFDPCSGTGTPMGKWTFGFLMEQAANTPLTGVTASEMAQHWIQQFEAFNVINGDPVPDRGGAIQTSLIDKWNAKNIAEGNHPFDPVNAPFRLTAIVNRIDLREGSAYATGNAGELRFVFCAMDLDTCNAFPLTVIWEFGVPISGCANVRSYAQDWQALSDPGLFPFGPVFNTALEALTDISSLANADPGKPNGSALNQLRTNNFLGGPWTLREFKITGSTPTPNHLTEVVVAQTPAQGFQGSTTLVDYINTFETDILAGLHVVPALWPGASPFQAAKAEVPFPSFHWNGPGIANNDARHLFSAATCSGCHGGEASGSPSFPPGGVGSFPFVHVGQRNPGVEASLSNFLMGTNMPMPDPVSGVPRTFNDLLRREADLDFAANMPCFLVALAPRVAAPH
ncbi:MAG: hypothetical protein HKN82_16315 [Akkermansiaceae bacterium]|nr:hypothetical protein [Akkermansiaceae bacterium]